VTIPSNGLPLGYLVTRNRRGGVAPVAFVLGASRTSLGAALRLYASRARRRAIDWRKWVGFTLIPINSRGRRIQSERFAAGRFIGDGHFALATSVGVAMERHPQDREVIGGGA
jgi:hypothetical protein